MPISRAEHVGSLKRPAALLQKRSDFQNGQCTAEELKVCEDECIAEVVRMQLELGLTTVTDGEYRRTYFYDGIYDCVTGTRVVKDPPEHMFQGKMQRTKPLYGEAFDFLKKVAGPENVGKLKVTMGSPEWYHFRHGKYTYEPSAYSTDDEYFADLAKVYREEIQDLYSRGCRRIQIDDPILTCFCDEKLRNVMVQEGVDPEALLDTYIRVINGCVWDRPAGMVVGIHLCRGNVKPNREPFTWGPYDRIAKKLFNELNVDYYYLEYDTERAGTFGPLRYLPRNKHVVLGLVSTKTPEVEDPETLRGRIMQAAEVIARGEITRSLEDALDQLSLSPQCGFASHAPGFEIITHEVMAEKLKLVVDVARTVWGKP
ncbi:UROD/MetE-like protein [Pilatotrama ljubarskyi]|nr:UROD/MetE-like protein [Pilatotrama ljubarskyi]